MSYFRLFIAFLRLLLYFLIQEILRYWEIDWDVQEIDLDEVNNPWSMYMCLFPILLLWDYLVLDMQENHIQLRSHSNIHPHSIQKRRRILSICLRPEHHFLGWLVLHVVEYLSKRRMGNWMRILKVKCPQNQPEEEGKGKKRKERREETQILQLRFVWWLYNLTVEKISSFTISYENLRVLMRKVGSYNKELAKSKQWIHPWTADFYLFQHWNILHVQCKITLSTMWYSTGIQ